MELVLQMILLTGTVSFSLYILNKVRIKKLELRYTLVWLFACLAFLVLAIFPVIIEKVAQWISVKDDVNALFLLIFFFVLMIIFSLTCSVSDTSKRINTLTQEIGILKLEMETMKEQKRNKPEKR